ncbi:MAG: TerC family protein [Candidatus Tectomicrobia bacterium]|nr:TerC family protein [Candidatus Tectomicrobia bacterium]
MTGTLPLWIGFTVFVVTVMVLDLGVFHRKAHAISLREAAIWTVVWVLLAFTFNGVIYIWQGNQAALEFLTGYIIEWSLSMDNVFVFAVIFAYFAVPKEYQHRVLFWGILGAVIMRLTFIVAGAALLQKFHWVIYVFGLFVLLTGIKLFFHKTEDMDLERNLVLRLALKLLAITPSYEGQKFFVRDKGRLLATPLLLVLIVVEGTDVMFAFDSIPAIFAITRDPFIVYTSNIFAILGLRALYFLLAGMMGMFRYLDTGLAVILCFVGVKMLLSEVYKIPIGLSLGMVCFILAVSVIASIYAAKAEAKLISEGQKTPQV